MTSLSFFNKAVYDFIADLKKMSILPNEIKKLETYVEVTKINARLLIRNFQSFFLRDKFVSNILSDNIEFFITYNPSLEEIGNEKVAFELIERIQNVVTVMLQNNQNTEITATFNWLKILCFHAYGDLNIDPTKKFTSLQMASNIGQ